MSDEHWFAAGAGLVLGIVLTLVAVLPFTRHEAVALDTGSIAQAIHDLAPVHERPRYEFLLSADGKTLWVVDSQASGATVWRLDGTDIKQVTDHPYSLQYRP